MDIHFDETGDGVARLLELDRLDALVAALRAEIVVDVVDVRPRVDEYMVLDAMTGEQRRILIEDAARDELAVALRRSSRVMQDIIDVSRILVGVVPDVLTALKAGQISPPHARIIADAAQRLPEETVDEFVERVLPVARRGTLAATRRAVKRAVLALDGEGEARRREQAKAFRDVWVTPEADGMSLLIARMTTEDALACKVQIDAAGFDRAFSVDAKAGLSLGEYRVEALAAMVLGGDGAGPVPAAVVRDLLNDPDCAVTLRRLVTDPVTGHLLDYGRRTYDIPQGLRDYVIARDRTCRFPGCNRRADLCQVDHAVSWDDGGETKPQNLGALCTRHHQLKTHGGWEITESRPDGTCIWRSPQGRYYDGGPDPSGASL